MESNQFGLRALGLLLTAALLAGTGTANAAGLALPAPWVACAKRSGPNAFAMSSYTPSEYGA